MRDKAAILCAAFLKAYCKEKGNCQFCPFLKRNGDCKLAGDYNDEERPYMTPDMWEVDSYED